MRKYVSALKSHSMEWYMQSLTLIEEHMRLLLVRLLYESAVRSLNCTQGGEVTPRKYNDPPVKLGRPGKPVVAVFQNGKRKVFTSLSEASDVLGISRHTINRALHGENTQVVGIRFEW